MDMINEVEQFMREFIKNEYEFWVAFYNEREYANLKPYIDKMVKYCKPRGLASGFGRLPSDPPESWFKSQSKNLEYISERLLFQIKEYDHPEFNKIYKCYLSSTSSHNSYSDIYYISKIKDELKIISIYIHNYESYLTKEEIDEWRYAGGKEIFLTASPINVMKFTPPKNKDHLIEYESE
jgi:hypothetical protein